MKHEDSVVMHLLEVISLGVLTSQNPISRPKTSWFKSGKQDDIKKIICTRFLLPYGLLADFLVYQGYLDKLGFFSFQESSSLLRVWVVQLSYLIVIFRLFLLKWV